MGKYNPKEIESKWQEYWKNNPDLVQAKDDSKEEKKFVLDMFPYPSGAGLHIGHVESYTATDIYSRYFRMKGFNVLHPQGFDAFGLPAENYAVKTGVHPKETTREAIGIFKKQINSLGFSYDWSREVNSSTPEYYKWTQWLFLLFYKNGLAYKKKAKVNWCPKCQTVLANEQAENGKCDRCESEVVQKDLEQWFFRITDYVEDKPAFAEAIARQGEKTAGLISGLDKIDWPQSTKSLQKNWIGKSEGVEFELKIENCAEKFSVYTTRVDTVFGMTYVVTAPEHEIVWKLKDKIENWPEVEKYIEEAKKKTDLDRMEAKEKTGVEIKGIKVINPFNGEKLPLFVADYVLSQYGTGAVMAVPAHDERDFEFAKKYDLPIKQVIVDRDKESNAIIVHGSNSTEEESENGLPENDRHWKLWIRKELEKIKIRVSNELYPEDWLPDYEKWKKVFEKNEISKDSILIGHSAGTAFLLRWLDENKREVDKVILVAPSVIKGGKYLNLSKLKDFEFDSTLNKYFKELIIFYSDNDDEDIVNSAIAVNKKIGGKLINLPKNGHFTLGDMGTEKFPELIREILRLELAYTDDGILVNSQDYSGWNSEEAREKISVWIEEKKIGKKKINYKLRDWLVSRQRYWGAPIPIIYCEKCGEVPVPEKDLPVILPDDVDFKPTGESPLKYSEKFQKVVCPKCGAKAKRESDTMDTFVCSSWYYLRYSDPHNENEFASKDKLKKWLPVDLYVGGAEHSVLHLLYARFFTKVLHNLGYIDFDEPFLKLRHQGMILAEDGNKMSKSKGNVINPDDIVAKYGADALRMFEMFMGPLEDMKPWQTKGIVGIYRFLEKIWKMSTRISEQKSVNSKIQNILHKTIKKVSEDIENMKFNTAISQLMILSNEIEKQEELQSTDYKLLIILLSPFAPHLAEELWEKLGHTESIFKEKWPEYDEKLIQDKEISLVVQINGKVRDTIKTSADISEEDAKAAALESEKVKKYIVEKEIKKIIFIKGRLINIVI